MATLLIAGMVSHQILWNSL